MFLHSQGSAVVNFIWLSSFLVVESELNVYHLLTCGSSRLVYGQVVKVDGIRRFFPPNSCRNYGGWIAGGARPQVARAIKMGVGSELPISWPRYFFSQYTINLSDAHVWYAGGWSSMGNIGKKLNLYTWMKSAVFNVWHSGLAQVDIGGEFHVERWVFDGMSTLTCPMMVPDVKWFSWTRDMISPTCDLRNLSMSNKCATKSASKSN